MPVLTVILLAVAACGAPTTEDGVPLAPEETPAVVGTPSTRVWNEREGWHDLPPAPVAAPVERWRQQFPPGARVAADPEGSAVAGAHATGTQTTVTGIHLASFDLDALRAYRRAETMGNAFRRQPRIGT